MFQEIVCESKRATRQSVCKIWAHAAPAAGQAGQLLSHHIITSVNNNGGRSRRHTVEIPRCEYLSSRKHDPDTGMLRSHEESQFIKN